MKSKKVHKKIKQLNAMQQNQNMLLQLFFDNEPIIMGTLAQVNRTCGNPTCHCAQGGGHPTWTLLTKYQGKRRCQVVRKNDVAKVKEKIKKYQLLKKSLREIRLTDSLKYKVLREVLEDKNHLYD